MFRAIEWLSAGMGAILCIVVALIFWQSQQGTGSSLWPLPALTLLGVALLGFVGLLSIALDENHHLMQFGMLTWSATGALAGLMILGVFTIGIFLFPAVVFLGSAAFLADRHRQRRTLPGLAGFMIGAAGSMLFVLFINVLAYGRV